VSGSEGGLRDVPAGSTVPNRTIVSQLVGTDSLSSLTDDDGQTWIPNQGGGIVSGVDHQTIGAGPYAQPFPPNPVYPNAVYYCSQDLVNALCARSDDGGLTYGPPIPIYNSDSCGGIHGHVKVGPDGAVYVPNKTCGTDALAAPPTRSLLGPAPDRRLPTRRARNALSTSGT